MLLGAMQLLCWCRDCCVRSPGGWQNQGPKLSGTLLCRKQGTYKLLCLRMQVSSKNDGPFEASAGLFVP